MREGTCNQCKCLLDQGADVDATDEQHGNTALMLAANGGHIDILRLLLDAGADVHIKAKDGWTALVAAEMIGNLEAASLIKRGAASTE